MGWGISYGQNDAKTELYVAYHSTMAGQSVWANMSYKSNMNIEEMRQAPKVAMA